MMDAVAAYVQPNSSAAQYVGGWSSAFAEKKF